MLEVSQALELSFYLGLLNYALGNLLLGSPIPFPSVKRLGMYMVKDAIAIWILASSFTIILNLVAYVRGILGLSWEQLQTWLGLLLLKVTSYLGLIKMLSGLIGSVSSYLSPILSRLSSLLSTSMISILALQILGVIVSTRYSEILAAGILMYSLPLGIFKRAGSILIAFTIVFTTALPALPLFITAIYPSEPEMPGDRAFPLIEVRDLTGGPLGNSLLLLYESPTSPPGAEVAALAVDSSGHVSVSTTPGLPINRAYYFSLEMFGWRFYSSSSIYLGSECIVRNCSYTVTIDGVLVSDSPYILIHTPPTLTYYIIYKDPGAGYLRMVLHLAGPSVLIATAPSHTVVKSLYIDGNSTAWDDRRTWSWAGVEGYNYYKALDPGLHTVEIQYVRGMPIEPLLIPFYRVGDDMLKEMFSNAILLLFISTVFPAVYITLLSMATYSLARLIERGAR